MNEQNVNYLKERIFFLGFGDNLNAELEKNIKAQREQFQLQVQGEFTKAEKKQLVDYTLDFTKSKQNDQYFLNSYKATLRNDDPEKERSQTFYINKGNGITAKEAFNLLDGRAVYKKLTNKEGEPYEAWLQLHASKEENGNHRLQQYHTAWGYDLKRSLEKHPVKELGDNATTDQLMKSLQKGNLVQVNYKRSEQDEKMFIAANPKERNILVYDADMRKQFQGIKEHKTESSEVKEDKSERKSQKQSNKDTPEEAEPGERKTRTKRMSA
jgi:hypothetical protein